ncbi:MAG TPA: Cof-type HAD-IIB family hydrolase [Clostridia bacterium]
MEYKLVAIDMDGTLLTPDLKISKRTVKTISNVIENKVMVTLSTGRMYSAALPLANELQLDVPIITCNGALTKCSRTGKVYDMKTISENLYIEILNYLRDAGLSASVYDNDEIFIEKNSENLDIHADIDYAKPKIVENLESVYSNSIIKILFSSRDKSKLKYHTHKLYEAYEDKLNFYFSLPHFVEIVNKSANKKNALESLSKSLSIKRAEIIAIGDNFNDLDMIQYAGLGVAMGNAPDYLKEEADYVTSSNDEDGVRHVLEKFILNYNNLH